MDRLWAVATVLRTAAGLDGQQRRQLHVGRVVVLPVHGLRTVHQFGQRQVQQGLHLGHGPAIVLRWRGLGRSMQGHG